MTLFATDYLEYYLTLVSWIVNNGIWAVLVSSGVFALPFVTIIVQEWLKARAEGADEGNKGVLSAARIENRVFVAIVVVMFAGIPFIDVDLNTIQYDSSRSAQCQVSVPPCFGRRQGAVIPGGDRIIPVLSDLRAFSSRSICLGVNTSFGFISSPEPATIMSDGAVSQ